MCWTSWQRFPYKRVAHRDIKVYKYLRKDLRSPYYHRRYSLNVLNIRVHVHTELIYNETDAWEINEGYHSYTKNRARDLQRHYVWLFLYECIIPKDTIFYTNELGEIVSENIIIKKCVGLVDKSFQLLKLQTNQ